MYTLRYIGTEPDLSQQWTFETPEDIFVHVAEWAADELEEGEHEFDDPAIEELVEALRGKSYESLIRGLNAIMNCDYFEVYSAGAAEEPVGSYKERMAKVFASVEKARVEWQEVEDEK